MTNYKQLGHEQSWVIGRLLEQGKSQKEIADVGGHKFTISRPENLVEFYKKADGKTKKKILGSIFSGKLNFGKSKSCN